MTEAEREAIRRARSEYLRLYRRKNPQKQREAQDRFWLKKAAAMEAEAATLAE